MISALTDLTTYHQSAKQQSAKTDTKQNAVRITTNYDDTKKTPRLPKKEREREESTGEIGLDGADEIGMPEIAEALAELHLVEVVLRRHRHGRAARRVQPRWGGSCRKLKIKKIIKNKNALFLSGEESKVEEVQREERINLT